MVHSKHFFNTLIGNNSMGIPGTGIVDQDIDLPSHLVYLLSGAPDMFLQGEIGRHQVDPGIRNLLQNLVSGAITLLNSSRHQNKMVFLSRQLQGGLIPNTGRSSGQYNYFIHGFHPDKITKLYRESTSKSNSACIFVAMKNTYIRILGILMLALLLLLIGKFTSFGDWFVLENISKTIKSSGAWGLLIFTVLFILGSLLHIPAMLFILVAILVYGHVEGAVLGYLGVVIAMSVNYFVIRTMGHKVLNEIKNPRLQRMLLKLQTQPLLTIILIRLVFWASPVVNYALAMTSVKPRHYILGSAVGLIPPVIFFTGVVYFFKELIIP